MSTVSENADKQYAALNAQLDAERASAVTKVGIFAHSAKTYQSMHDTTQQLHTVVQELFNARSLQAGGSSQHQLLCQIFRERKGGRQGNAAFHKRRIRVDAEDQYR